MRLLLVEDTPDVSDAVRASFQRRGDAVDHADTLAHAFDCVATHDYDVVILDVSLPDGLGTDLLAALRRARKATPVLVLTARMAVDDRVSTLDLGADDYLTKPFDLRELHARVRALARRAGPDRGGVVKFGALSVDPAGRVAHVRGAPLTLTRREFSLLEALIANRGRVMAKDRLFDRMFALEDEEIGLNAIETYVSRLRRSLEGSGVGIRTLRGLGYQLVRTEDGPAGDGPAQDTGAALTSRA